MSSYDAVAKHYDEHYARPIDVVENRTLARLLAPHVNGKKVYDLGAGTGLLLDLGLTPLTYVAIESSSAMLEVLAGKHRTIHAICGVAEAPVVWWDANYLAGCPDTVTALFAANYFTLLETAMNAFAHMNHGGTLFLHGAAPRNAKRSNFILQKHEPSFATWTPRNIRKTLEIVGFKDIRFKPVNGLPDWVARRTPAPLLQSLSYLAATLLPLRAQYHFAVTATRP